MILIQKQICRYLFTGVINTVFGYSVYSGLVFLGLGYSFSLLIATVTGVVFNYYTFGKVVFNTSHDTSRLFKFIFCYVITYCLNLLMLSFLISFMELDLYISQALCIPPSFIINWFLFKFWVYKNTEIKEYV